MPSLDNYNSFGGRHWETGSVHNALDFQGAKAPHTGKAYSEDFLLGLSGGITFGYFTFQYSDLEPQLALLTRNTFDPFQTLLERMGVVQDLYQSANKNKGLDNLNHVLEEGQAAIVWADSFSMPYEAHASRTDYWAMYPIVVYSHDGQQAKIADRAKVPLLVSAADLEFARAKIKKDKFRVMSISAPKEEKLIRSVNLSIWQCIRIFTEAPPKGSKNNFGFNAYAHWANMLINQRNKQSWSRFFHSKSGHFSAIAGFGPFPGLLDWVNAWGDEGADRARYARFLDEAALLLNLPKLNDSALLFMESHQAWQSFSSIAAPSHIPLLAEANRLIQNRNRLFTDLGGESLKDRQAINVELSTLSSEWTNWQADQEKIILQHRDEMAQAVLKISEIEEKAISHLASVMAK